MIGKVVGNYHIVEKIGEGGMGAVYKGIDLMLERPVAIKVLHSTMANNENLIERFRREAKALARVSHANIASLYNLVQQDGEYFMIMEYIAGPTLESLIVEQGRMPYKEAYSIFTQVLTGVGYAHNKGIIHRDLKPSNIILNTEGVVKITDFGIALMLGTAGLTQTGTTLGSLYYVSPEQIRAAHSVDGRADIYSLGVVFYQMLSGELPFKGESIYDVMRKHIEATPPLLRRLVQDIPPGVEIAILQALSKEAKDRFASVEEFRRALPLPDAVSTFDSARQTGLNHVAEKVEDERNLPTLPLAAEQKPAEKTLESKFDRSIIVQPAPEKPVQTPQAGKPRSNKILVASAALSLIAVVGALLIVGNMRQKPSPLSNEAQTAAPSIEKSETTDSESEPENSFSTSEATPNSSPSEVTIPYLKDSPTPTPTPSKIEQRATTPKPAATVTQPTPVLSQPAARRSPSPTPTRQPSSASQRAPQDMPPAKTPSTAPTIIP